MTATEVALRAELLRLMPVNSDNSWGPNPVVCRWCACWLEYNDNSQSKPAELHEPTCFAAVHLGRPHAKRSAS